MSSWTVERILTNAGDPPSLPDIYYQISFEVDNPNSSINKISEIITRDQALTSRLLRIANSAFYGFSSRVDTISEALQRIGLRELRDLVLCSTVIDQFETIPQDIMKIEDFWKHSIYCAICSAALASERHEASPERFFVGGLLHDIGRLILLRSIPEETAEVFKLSVENDKRVYTNEAELIGPCHDEVGAALLNLWKLPPNTIEMVRYHHSPTLSSNSISEASIIHIADFLANAFEWGKSGEICVPPLSKQAWELSGLDIDCLDRVVETTSNRGKEMVSILTS